MSNRHIDALNDTVDRLFGPENDDLNAAAEMELHSRLVHLRTRLCNALLDLGLIDTTDINASVSVSARDGVADGHVELLIDARKIERLVNRLEDLAQGHR